MKLQICLKAFFWIFGVITCGYYAVITMLICSQNIYCQALFAPLLLIAPANAASLLLALRKNPTEHAKSLVGTLNTMALVVSGLLATGLIPLCLLASIGGTIGAVMIIAAPIQLFFQPSDSFAMNVKFGAMMCGVATFYIFVALGPLLTALHERTRLRFLQPRGSRFPGLPMSSCISMILAIVVITIMPSALTKTCSAAVTKRETLPEGLLLLRAVGNDQELLQACYGIQGALPWFFSLSNISNYSEYEYGMSGNPQMDAARQTYYRVKGKPFNSVPRPATKYNSFNSIIPFGLGGDASSFESTYEYDRDFAGEAVGGVVNGFVLTNSDIRGWVDPNEAVAHLKWDMDFKSPKYGRELRAQILLPPGAVIDSCSLWIKGVEHKAVIGTRQSTRTAYVRSAHSGETPLLLSTAGAGRVLLQSATGWWGPNAKLKIELTSPLVITSPSKARLPLPFFTERNFSVQAQHQISILTPTSTIVETYTNADLTNKTKALTFDRNPSATKFIANDPTDNNQTIVQEVLSENGNSATPLIVVVDGSSTMSNWMNQVSDVLKSVNAKNASIIWASDIPKTVIAQTDSNSLQWKATVNKLKDSSALGGQNNAEALRLAIDQIQKANYGSTNIVWLHGPQPVAFSDYELQQLLNKAKGIRLFEYQLVAGPNEVIKSLNKVSSLTQVPRLDGASQDLVSLFQHLSGSQPNFRIARHAVKSSDGETAKHPLEIVKLFTSDYVNSSLPNTSDPTSLGALAEWYNLVTPLTSALVLPFNNYDAYQVKRHAQQQAAISPSAGLQKSAKLSSHGGLVGPPIDPRYGQSNEVGQLADAAQKKSSITDFIIPAKPEPPISWLVCCALIMVLTFLWTRRRRQEQS